MKGFSALFQRFHPLHQLELARQKWQAQPPRNNRTCHPDPRPDRQSDRTGQDNSRMREGAKAPLPLYSYYKKQIKSRRKMHGFYF